MRLQTLSTLAVLALAAPGAADTAGAGFSATDLPSGGPTYESVTLSNGDFVGIGDSTIVLFAPDGTPIRTLHTFMGVLPPEAIVVDPTETFVVASRSDGYSGGTYRVDLAGGPATYLSFLGPSWMVFEGPDSVLGCVGNGFFNWSLFRLDVNTGAFTQKSAMFPAVNMPLGLDAAGNLYLSYEPGFTGNYVIERFPAAQVAGGGQLSPGEGTVVRTGFDILSDFAVTADGSTFFVAEIPALGVSRILASTSSVGHQELLRITPPEYVFDVQFRPGTAPAKFLAFQPATGGELVYQTRFGSARARRSLAPARPVASVSGPGTSGSGPYDLTLTGGPPHGRAIVFFGPLSGYNPNEPAYPRNGIPLFFGLQRSTAHRAPGSIQLDANGNAVQPYVNNAESPNMWAIQALLRDEANKPVATTTAVSL